MALDLTSLDDCFQVRTKTDLAVYPKTNIIRYLMLLCSIFYITKVHAINTEKEMTIQERYCFLLSTANAGPNLLVCSMLPRLFRRCSKLS